MAENRAIAEGERLDGGGRLRLFQVSRGKGDPLGCNKSSEKLNSRICSNRADQTKNPQSVFHLYRCKNRSQLSFVDFFLPFAGTLSGDYRLSQTDRVGPMK